MSTLGPMDTPEAYVGDIGCTVFGPRGRAADHAITLCASVIQVLQALGLTVNRSNTAVTCENRGVAINVARMLGADTAKTYVYGAVSGVR